MEISERAKQFGAFAAVKGFEKELRKREEIFEKKGDSFGRKERRA